MNFGKNRGVNTETSGKFDVSTFQKFQFMKQNRNSSDNNKIVNQKDDYTFKIDK